ncbi:hypothetical protein EG352_07525 [Chryseobacterium indologenes]|uniref:Uncharacterized protein n=1 Tax=Chryseobacterium indologenes TaxID=253 RepID=A0AAD0YUX2_CHRID|nr:hypothetical protein [Chryseobacterium indologenes]AZB17627.1 hypothetical protein EG352_07525 [Chryseobacterium indologenes]
MANNFYFFDTEGNDDESYDKALNFAEKLIKANKGLKRIIYLVPSKNSTGWLDRLYGVQTVKKMFNGVNLSGTAVKIETIRTYTNSYNDPSDIVICCGLNSEEIFKVQDYRQVDTIIAIPWQKENTDSWIKTAKAIKINEDLSINKEVSSNAYPEPSEIVKKAFKELTLVINTSTGINHPSDNARAKTYVRALHKYEPELNSDIVCSYLINAMGWKVSHADDIRKLIDTLNSGKYFKGGEKTGLQIHYKRWKTDKK